MPGRTERPSAAGAVTRNVPRGCVADSESVSRTSSISARMRVTERSSISPSSVIRIMRVFLSNSLTPSEFSSVWRRLLTLPGVISNSDAAAEILLSAATRAKTRIPWTSIVDPPEIRPRLCPEGQPPIIYNDEFVAIWSGRLRPFPGRMRQKATRTGYSDAIIYVMIIALWIVAIFLALRHAPCLQSPFSPRSWHQRRSAPPERPKLSGMAARSAIRSAASRPICSLIWTRKARPGSSRMAGRSSILAGSRPMATGPIATS